MVAYARPNTKFLMSFIRESLTQRVYAVYNIIALGRSFWQKNENLRIFLETACREKINIVITEYTSWEQTIR